MKTSSPVCGVYTEYSNDVSSIGAYPPGVAGTNDVCIYLTYSLWTPLRGIISRSAFHNQISSSLILIYYSGTSLLRIIPQILQRSQNFRNLSLEVRKTGRDLDNFEKPKRDFRD
jgi:hypothetical protein